MLFLNLAAIIAFVGIKVRILHGELALKEGIRLFPAAFLFSSTTEKFTVGEAESSYHAVVP